MHRQIYVVFSWVLVLFSHSQTTIKDIDSNLPVSYATVSFGNGQGIFADNSGVFVFTKKLYPDIDSLFISALGYQDLKITTQDLQQNIYLKSKANELEEIVIDARINQLNKKKYKVESLKPYLDDDYYKCWLPTIESEIAVFFPNNDTILKQIAAVKFPIALESKDWSKRKRANSEKKKFSTLFKVKFYTSVNGSPGEVLTYETIVFRATENDGDYHQLDVSNYNLIMPVNGVFVSLQVMGYTDKKGILLPNKKYKEIKGRKGIVKIPTNFRPLLPFTNSISEHKTYVKRVFINGNKWQAFKKGNSFKSSLLDKGLNNYGMGLDLHVFKQK